MKKLIRYSTLNLLFILFFGLSSSISADIATPVAPVAKSIWIETHQDYPDYDFYIASFDRTSTYDYGRRTREWTTHYYTLDLRPITLTARKAYKITSDVYGPGPDNDATGSDDGVLLYLIGVKKGSGVEGTDDLDEQVVNLAEGKESKVFGQEIGVYDTQSISDHISDQSFIYSVEGLGDSGFQVSRRNGERKESENSDSTKAETYLTSTNIGLGLLFTGLIVLAGLLLVRKM